jgi:hypothetical protein
MGMSKKEIEVIKCKRCSRQLKDPESRKIGYGPTCLERTPAVMQQQLERAGQIRLPGIA